MGKPVTIVLDNGLVHTSKATRAALAEREHRLTPEWLPKYAPDLNDIEREWKILKAHHLAHKTFKTRDSLKAAIDADIKSINSRRKTQVLANCLERTELAHLAPDLDRVASWERELTSEEQQKFALARVLLRRSRGIVLDQAIDYLDEEVVAAA